MDTWGVGAFENDIAADWLYELEESVGDDVLHEVFDDVLCPSGAAPDVIGSVLGLAAAETVAAWGGRAPPDAPIEVLGWVAVRDAPHPTLVHKARQAVECIGGGSELRSAWLETPDAADWVDAVQDLQRRLAALTPRSGPVGY